MNKKTENPLYDRVVKLYNDLRSYTEAADNRNRDIKENTFSNIKDKLTSMSEDEIMETGFDTMARTQMHSMDITNMGMRFIVTYENAKLIDSTTQFPDEIRDTYLSTRGSNFYILNKKGNFEELNKDKVQQTKDNFKKMNFELITKELERQTQGEQK